MKKKHYQGPSLRTLMAAILTFVVLSALISKDRVASASMEPTLMTGDIVLFDSFFYRIGGLNRGDIIEFTLFDTRLSKRVIGLSGDKISFSDGNVFVNGVLLEEPYLPDGMKTESEKKEFIVPGGYLFLLGDNRSDSYDSRFLDDPYIRVSSVTGRYIFTLKHTNAAKAR